MVCWYQQKNPNHQNLQQQKLIASTDSKSSHAAVQETVHESNKLRDATMHDCKHWGKRSELETIKQMN